MQFANVDKRNQRDKMVILLLGWGWVGAGVSLSQGKEGLVSGRGPEAKSHLNLNNIQSSRKTLMLPEGASEISQIPCFPKGDWRGREVK